MSSLLSIPNEVQNLVLEEVLSVENLQTIEKIHRYGNWQYQLRWKAPIDFFTVSKELSSSAIKYFYEKNMFVAIYANNRDFFRLLAKVVPILSESEPGPPDHVTSRVALTIIMREILDHEVSYKMPHTIIAGTYLPRFVQLINSSSAPFHVFCLAGPGWEGEHQYEYHQFSFHFNSTVGYYAGKPHIAEKLAHHLRNLRLLPLEEEWVRHRETRRDGHLIRRLLGIKITGIREEIVANLVQTLNQPRLLTEDEFIAESELLKLEGDNLAGQDGELFAARAAYSLAGLMICKLSFPTILRFVHGPALPEPEILQLSLQLWLSASRLSSKMGRYIEALWSIQIAYLVSRKSHRDAVAPNLKLQIAMEYADVPLQEIQHSKRGEKLDMSQYWTKPANFRKSRPRPRPLCAFDHAQSILQGASDRNPDNVELRKKLAACKALRPKNRTRARRPIRGMWMNSPENILSSTLQLLGLDRRSSSTTEDWNSPENILSSTSGELLGLDRCSSSTTEDS